MSAAPSDGRGVFAEHAPRWRAAGWPGTLPLPPGKKLAPPDGFTGQCGRDPSDDEVAQWAQKRPNANLAIRLPLGVVGVDVDHYKPEGASSWAELNERCGPLPPTYMVTSRDDGASGIRLFRISAEGQLRGDFAPGIDTIRHEHRYIIPAGTHPEGRPYRLLDCSGQPAAAVPPPSALPELPEAWLAEIVERPSANGHVAPNATEDAWRTVRPASWMDDVVARFNASRSWADVLEPHGWQFVRTDSKGIEHWTRPGKDTRDGTSATVNANGTDRLIVHSTSTPFQTTPTSYDRFGAHVVLTTGRTDDAARVDVARDLGPSSNRHRNNRRNGDSRVDSASTRYAGPPVLPEDFWHARPIFGHIRQAAHSRLIAADGVLGGVLARVAVATDYRIVLPATVARVGSLNIIVALVAPSGAGKGGVTDTAAELVPFVDHRDHRIRETSAGSGEGMVKQFFSKMDISDDPKKPKIEWRQTHHGVLVRADEGSLFAALAQRRGQTTIEMLRAAWSGERLGGAYVDADRGHQLSAHAYRLALVMGVQPELAAPIFADIIGGLPQRVLWLAVVDPHLPELDEIIDWPGALEWTPPAIDARNLDESVRGVKRCQIDLPPSTAIQLRRDHLARGRGDSTDEALEVHANLGRLKIAALLGVLDGRLAVDDDDWELAGIVTATSTAVRSWVQQRIGNAERLRAAAATDAHVKREVAAAEAVDDVRSLRKARRVHRYVTEAAEQRGHATMRDVVSRFGGHERDDLDFAIDAALERQWIRRGDQDDTFVPGESRPS